MKNVCGLYRLEPRLPKRQLSSTHNKPACGLDDESRYVVLHGCVLRVPSDTHASMGSGKYSFCYDRGLYCCNMSFGWKNAHMSMAQELTWTTRFTMLTCPWHHAHMSRVQELTWTTLSKGHSKIFLIWRGLSWDDPLCTLENPTLI